MATRSAGALVVALLIGAPRGVPAQLAVPSGRQAVPAAPAPPAAPGQQPVADDGSKRLGRKYPVPSPPPVAREPPEVHVSVVSPQDSGVHQHAARQRMQRAARSGGDLGGDAATNLPLPPVR